MANIFDDGKKPKIEKAPILYSIKEASAAAGYNEQHVSKLCRERKIPHIEKNGRYYFLAEDVVRLQCGKRVEADSNFSRDPHTEGDPAPADCDGGIKGDDAIKGEPDLGGLL
jgi:hypothetical protein